MTSQPSGTPGEWTMSTQEARENWAALLRHVRESGNGATITHYGTPVARVIPSDSDSRRDLQRLADTLTAVQWDPAAVVGLVTKFLAAQGIAPA